MLDLKKANNLNVISIAMVMVLSAFLSIYFSPKPAKGNSKPAIELEKNIPQQFGDWKVDQYVSPITVPADLQSKLDELYSEVLSRTYINSQGQRVMLSIAYGRNQGGESTQVHRPEICYRAQGFTVGKQYADILKTQSVDIPVQRLMSSMGERLEPITYWILLGEHLVKSGLDRKIWQVKYGFQRKMPDGLLLRVSTIGADREAAYQIQDQFVNEMLNSLSPDYKKVIIGSRSDE
ncbi:EpsI family protein [Deefgea tanakiae]|uniref:EpsI family protein n=1 Tax=Deefgea tanakiae TaxID=2865840 RepID=A0ABX8Z6L5_9NEIS|nr:exosortase-associated protein EpsI, B-type [Deefgea tanakiae]QZA78231.1 EpsI family protein [Deefgea tanakiae]